MHGARSTHHLNAFVHGWQVVVVVVELSGGGYLKVINKEKLSGYQAQIAPISNNVCARVYIVL